MNKYHRASNKDLYVLRKEPAILRTGESYINLRTCEDPDILEGLEKELKSASSSGEEYVIAPWLSPPFNRIIGYGLYTKKQAKILRKRNKDENWRFPCFGRAYTLQDIKYAINSCLEPISRH